jgi:hypothetical protein
MRMRATLRRPIRLLLMLALCAGWAATPLIAQMCAASPALCQRHMPGCPRSHSAPGCSPALCPALESQRAVKQRAFSERVAVRPAAIRLHAAAPAPALPQRELTSGLHYSPPVFQLKDDLRI